MIVNYDDENGWSSIFKNIGKDKIAYAPETDKAILNDIKDRIKLESQLSNKVNWDGYIKGHQNASESLKSFLKDTDYAEKSLTNYNSYLEKTGKTTSKFSAIADKATSVVKSIGSVAANMAIGAGVGFLISSVIDGITYLATYNERMAESAQNITSAWDESNSSLSEQISKYKELKSQLDSGTLTPSEEYSTRQQILDIQTQITSQYGDQVEGINLVNGALDVQLAKLQQIAAENAKTQLNKSQDEYNNVVDQMERQRLYTLSDTVSGTGANKNDGGIGSAIYDIAKEFEDAGLSIQDNGNGEGLYTIQFKGDASQADSTITDFMNRVSELKDTYTDQNSINVIDGFVNYSSDALKENQEILDDYQESYNKFLQMDMMSRGVGEGTVADTYNKYAEAVQKYNEALASGDSDSIKEARADFNELSEEVDTLLSQGDNDKFTVLFDEITNSLDEASIKLNDFNEVLSGKAGDSNTFKDQAENIKSASDQLKEMKLDAQEVRDALITDGTQTGEEQILALADAWGLTEESIKNQDEAFTEFLTILSEAGIITGQVASATDTATASYQAFSSTVQTVTDNLSTLQGIMSESSSGSGISSDSVKAFRDMFGDDAEKALEKTANGYHINVDALRELQSQQETLTKSDYLSALSDQYELLAENSEKLAKAQFMGEDTSGLEATRQGILDQISSLQDLQLQYESATSAYQDWINAQNNGSERDMYDNIQSGYSTVTDLIERGWGGSDEVRTYVDLLSSADLSTASVEEVIKAYEQLGKTIGNSGYSILDFFTVDEDGNTTTDGIYNFFDTVNSVLGEEYAKINENGEYEFNFGDGRDQEVADKLKMDVEAVQAILRAASEAGFEVNLDQPIASLEELKTSAQSAQESLANMKDTSLSDINLDSTSFSEITDDISQVEEYIDKINDDDTLEPDVKTEKLENANAILEYLVEMQNEAGSNNIEISVNAEEVDQKIADAKEALEQLKNEDGVIPVNADTQPAIDNMQAALMMKEKLDAPAVMDVDTSKVDGELGDALAKIQEYQQAVQELNVQTELKAQGVDIDTSAAQAKVDSLVSELQGMNIDTKLNIDTSSAATIQSSIQAITPEILVKAGVDETAITAFASEEKQAKGKVTWDNNTSLVDLYASTEKKASGTVTWGNDTQNVRTHFSATGTISWSGDGPKVNGTAHANGSTVKSYHFNNWSGQANASGNWGIREGGTSLVGELGQEILVRGSEFHTIGDNGAEFIQTRPGDIIFNHKQTEALLKNGYVTSRGKMIGSNANVNGSASSSGSGGLGRPSRPSYGMDDSYASNSSSKKSSSSKSSSKSSEKASKSAEKAADKFEEIVDSIETLLDRMDRSIQKLTDSIETYSYDLSKQSAASDKAMNTIRSNLTTLQSAYNRYIKEANSVGLSDAWKKRVQNGTIDITTITDEDLKDKIDEYQQWLRISGHLIYFIAGTSPQPCFATT